ncbi:MAG: DUF421 domain-containing protein [Thermoanaerobaculia bacterium]|nr:DUF421 domain-containing protein [Thermoanaerobaculia bacterium]
MTLARIAIRALVAYIYLLTLTRTSGKRVISEATPFDMLVSLIIGDLIDDALWAEVSAAKFAAAAGSICVIDILVTIGSRRSRWFHKLVNGHARVLIRNGVNERDAMRSEQLSEADVDHLVRLKCVDDREEIALGVMEIDHRMSVIRARAYEPAQRRDGKRVREAQP